MESLLDTITLKDNTQLHGIVDYVTTKHIYFFDFSKESATDYIMLVMLWKSSEKTETRFSVYCISEHPRTILPRVILIPKSNIKSSTKLLRQTKSIKQRRFQLKQSAA